MAPLFWSLGWLVLRAVTALRLHSMQLYTIAVIVLVNGWAGELPGSSGNHAECQHLFAVSQLAQDPDSAHHCVEIALA